MASALIIDDAGRERIEQLIKYASKPENHYRPGGPTPGDNPNYTVWLGTYRCVFTFTIMPDGLHRHLSVSVKRQGRWPLPEGVEIIGKLFGFQGPFTSWPKGMDHGTQAVVIAQHIDTLPHGLH